MSSDGFSIANRVLDSDLGSLREAARRFIEAQDARLNVPRALWQGIVQQGWISALLDTEAPAMRTLLMLSAELGRAAIALPLAESAAPLIAARLWPTDESLHALNRLAEGTSITLSCVGDGSRQRPEKLQFRQGYVTGELCNVEHFPIADALIVIDTTQRLLAWCELPGTRITAVASSGFADAPWHDISLLDTPMSVGPSYAGQWLMQVIRLAAVARAWGAAARSVEELADYVKIREQFGQVIGRFQAMQHRLANLQIILNAARALLSRAAWSLDASDADWQAHANAACCYAGRHLRQLALECQHGFGAVGYMEDHPMPRRFRRIHADLLRHAQPDRAATDLANRLLDKDDGPEYVTRRVTLTPSAEGLRRDVALWLDQHWSNDRRTEHDADHKNLLNFDRRFLKVIGEGGMIGITIPVADGGMGHGALEQYAFDEEINLRDAPSYSYATAQLLAPSLVRYGSAAQRERFLPLMLGGNAVFCLGYSEPNSGSDLASLKTRAERVGDAWIVNGSKIWTTLGTVGDYVWLAARTDPARARHGGISVFIVPLTAAGITIRPLRAMNGEQPCAVFYDDVRLPLDALVGEVNDGWAIITHALSQERMLMGAFASRLALYLSRIVAEIRHVAMRIPSFADRPGLHMRLGEIAAEVSASRLLALHASVVAAAGGKPVVEAAISKTFAGELEERIGEAAMDWFGADAVLHRGSTGALLDGLIPHSLVMGIMYVIGGGSNDIQRNIIAQAALGLPR